MDDLMVVLENLESSGQAGIRESKQGKVAVILHVAVGVQFGQKELQARHAPRLEVRRRHYALTELRSRRSKRASKVPEHVVALQPEPRRLSEVLMSRPDLPGIALQQHLQIIGPPGALVQIQSHRGQPSGFRSSRMSVET